MKIEFQVQKGNRILAFFCKILDEWKLFMVHRILRKFDPILQHLFKVVNNGTEWAFIVVFLRYTSVVLVSP